MERRDFLRTAALAAPASQLNLGAQAAMPSTTLGRSGLKVSRFTLGGYHMRVQGEVEALKIIDRAVELGVNFFDSANNYHRGESDVTYGKAFAGGKRQRVLLMTKCEIYSKDGAMRVLEKQLKSLQTDYIDLWQVHQVTTHAEAEQALGPNGSLEAFVLAKKQGKVRHIGFTGHADPEVHLKLLNGADVWETIQMPINLIDPHYLSFITNVLPQARKRGLGVLAMKSNGMGAIGRAGIAPIQECIRFTLSQDVDTLVSGVETIEQLEQNVQTVKSFKKLSPAELTTILNRTKQGKNGPEVEGYKRKPNSARHLPVHRDGDDGCVAG